MCDTCGCGEHEHSGQLVELAKDLMSKNDQYAQQNRDYFQASQILALNFVSSPGSGKTSLLVRTIADLKQALNFAVIEGDQQTDNDAKRIEATEAPVVQINTGKGCHLDAHAIGHAAHDLDLQKNTILLIENVGNLVCPAAFDLGEAHKVAVLSVTEGEDKPIKYPDMFHAADVMLLNKIDLLPYVDFNVEHCLDYAQRVNPHLKIFQISVKTGEGLDHWYQWLQSHGSN